MNIKEIDKTVKGSYENIAQLGSSNFCCRPSAIYSPEELEGIPESVLNLSSGCGNPVTSAELKEGEVILDIGSGGGIDLFLAAKRVGENGRVIGVDTSTTMIERALESVKEAGVENIEFRYGDARNLPIENDSIDVLISNCVIATIPEKDKVYAEIFRVLRPGGRILVSDVISDGELPDSIKNSPEAWAKCVVGIPEEDYLGVIKKTGFKDIEVSEKTDVPFPDGIRILSLKVKAYKPMEVK